MKNTKTKKFIFTIILSALVLSVSFSRTYASEINTANLLSLINQKRATQKLSPLKENINLDSAAALKSKDMINRNYFEHYAYGLTPWDFMKISGYDYLYAGENLAMDFNTSEGMVNAWMKSPKHRDNIMNPDYTSIGFGIVKGAYTENGTKRETTMVSNMFGRDKPMIYRFFDYLSKKVSLF